MSHLRILLFASLTVSLAAVALAAPKCSPGSTGVLAGCVGDTDIVPSCVDVYIGTHVVTAEDVAASPGAKAVFCLSQSGNSLCPTTAALGTITRNGHGNHVINLSDDESLKVVAHEGDVLEVMVFQVDTGVDVTCFRQGETQFVLSR